MADASFPQKTNYIKVEEKNNEEDIYEDSPDGFRKYLKKQFGKILCTSGIHEKDEGKDYTENRPLTPPQNNMATDYDGDTYNFNNSNRGLAIIINNEDFSESKDFGDRPGSSHDATSLFNSFNALGFKVLLFNDLPGWKMVEVLRSAVKEYDHTKADCFVCSILTHGDETWSNREWDRMGTMERLDLLFGTDGKPLATKAVLEMFNDQNCPSLKNKPRLFFLQACRGDKYDEGQTVLVKRKKPESFPQGGGGGNYRDGQDGKKDDVTDSSQKDVPIPPNYQRQKSLSSSVDPPEYNKIPDTVDAKAGGDDSDAVWSKTRDIPVSPAPLYQDCLVMYATPPGYYAWRRRTGAWFIQCLCKLLDSNVVEHVSLIRGLSYVCGKVAREYQSENPNNLSQHQKKEVPVIESMLIKDIFFTKKNKREHAR